MHRHFAYKGASDIVPIEDYFPVPKDDIPDHDYVIIPKTIDSIPKQNHKAFDDNKHLKEEEEKVNLNQKVEGKNDNYNLLVERNRHYCTNDFEYKFHKLYASTHCDYLINSVLHVYEDQYYANFEGKYMGVHDMCNELYSSKYGDDINFFIN